MYQCKSILVTDDSDDVRELIMSALGNEGYHVTGASNGQEALEKLKDMQGPTLVLLDLMMPIMNGWEFLAAQKQDVRFAAHQVLTISSVNQNKRPETAGTIQKPVNWNNLWDKGVEFCGAPPAS